MSGMSGKIIFCLLAAFCVLPLAAQAGDSIMTVEEAYLSSAESMIIKELANSSGRDAKIVALQYIEDSLNAGRMSPEVFETLKSLAGEGVFTTVTENGRVTNNYPDIRIRACELLGRTGSADAVRTLVSVLYVDNEPSVITAAVKSLGDIGNNDGNEVINMINWIARKFDIVLPTSSLAFEILNTYEKLAPLVEDKGEMLENIVRIASNYNYVTPVRTRAYEVLKIVQESESASGSGQQRQARPATRGSGSGSTQQQQSGDLYPDTGA